MEIVLIVIVVALVVGIPYFWGERFGELVQKIYSRHLTVSKCPKCEGVIGRAEASAAYIRLKDQMNEADFNRFGPKGIRQWPVVCPHCGCHCDYNISEKKLTVAIHSSIADTKG